MSHATRGLSQRSSILIACAVFACAGTAASAQSLPAKPHNLDSLAIAGAPIVTSVRAVADSTRRLSLAPGLQPVLWPAPMQRMEPRRPAALVPLYVSFGALQLLDAHSTMRALGNGHAERNPFVSTFTSEPGAMVGLKLASTAGTIYLTERLWRRHRGAALALMIAVNSAYAAVVLHNYRTP